MAGQGLGRGPQEASLISLEGANSVGWGGKFVHRVWDEEAASRHGVKSTSADPAAAALRDAAHAWGVSSSQSSSQCVVMDKNVMGRRS